MDDLRDAAKSIKDHYQGKITLKTSIVPKETITMTEPLFEELFKGFVNNDGKSSKILDNWATEEIYKYNIENGLDPFDGLSEEDVKYLHG